MCTENVCCAEGRQPVRDGSRSRKSRLEMKRTSSEGKALDEHPTKDETNYTHTHKAKSHVSFLNNEGMLNIDLAVCTCTYIFGIFRVFIINL